MDIDALLNAIAEDAFREGYDRAASENGAAALEPWSDRISEIRLATVPKIVARAKAATNVRSLEHLVKEHEHLRRHAEKLEAEAHAREQAYREDVIRAAAARARVDVQPLQSDAAACEPDPSLARWLEQQKQALERERQAKWGRALVDAQAYMPPKLENGEF